MSNSFVESILDHMLETKTSDQDLADIILRFVVTPNLNQKILYKFTDFFMNQEREVLECLSKSLVEKIKALFEELAKSEKQLQIDLASLIIDFINRVFDKHRAQTSSSKHLLHLTFFLMSLIINKNQNVGLNNEPCLFKVRAQVYPQLLINITRLLIENFNLGGHDNFKCFAMKDNLLFENLCYMVQMALKLKDAKGDFLWKVFRQNFRKFSNDSKDDLAACLRNLALWQLCNFNYKSTDLKSFVGPLLKKMHADINSLFWDLFENETIAAIFIDSLCVNFVQIHKVLSQRLQRSQLGYQSVYMMENALAFFTSVVGRLSKNDILAGRFLKHNSGLTLVFKTLCNQDTLSQSNKPSSQQSELCQLMKSLNESNQK